MHNSVYKMILDYENSSPQQIEKVETAFFTRGYEFCSSGKKYELHELVLKPEIGRLEGLRILEIGVEDGFHLGSYASLDYYGTDIDSSCLREARDRAQVHGLPSSRIVCRNDAHIPFGDNSMDCLFSVCTLHEVRDIQGELAEMDRVAKEHGKIIIVERMCAIGESPLAQANLKQEPNLVNQFFVRRGYIVRERAFKATYWGESLTEYPQFNFWMISAER